MLTFELLGSDEIQAVRGGGSWRLPELSSGGWALQAMSVPVLVDEGERFASPIHGRIVFFKPRHAEDDVVALERSDDEIHQLRVGADADADVADDSDGVTGAAISQAHLMRTFLRLEPILADEGLRDEIGGGAAVSESDGLGSTAKGSIELHENAAAGLHLLNAHG